MALTEDITALKAELVAAGKAAAQASQGATLLALLTAGIPVEALGVTLPEGFQKPKQNFGDAAALSSTSQNALATAKDAAIALSALEERFPTPDPALAPADPATP